MIYTDISYNRVYQFDAAQCQGKRVVMKSIFCATALLALACLPMAAQSTSVPDGRITGKNYAERAAAAVQLFATLSPANPNFPKEAMPFHAARLQVGTDIPGTLKTIDRMLDATLKAKPDPFNLHAVMHGYLLNREKFTPAMKAKVKALAANWSYTKPIGVSMNYELMRDGSGWLAAQEWPDLVDKDGNNAAKIQKNCAGWLMRIFNDTTSRNASEYDAPVYYGTDFGPARMIAEFAREEKLGTAARLTLDFMLVQTGAHWFHGYHISSAGRGKYWGSLNLSPDASSSTSGMAYLFFGGDRPAFLGHAPQTYWLAHPGHTLPVDWLPAWQASLPDDRLVLATHLAGNTKVWKMAWFTCGYGLASQREDGSAFSDFLYKECRRTMLKWISDKPSSTFTFIQENRRRPKEKILNAFAYGENPYCETMQHEGTLLGVYDVPEEYGFWKSHAPFTQSGAILKRTARDGWIICHGGSMLFAFRYTQPAKWGPPITREMLDLYDCDAPRGGWILETAPIATYAGGGTDAELQRFGDALLSKTKITDKTNSSPPRLTFTNLKGRTLDLTWKPMDAPLKDQCLVDGKLLDYSRFNLLETSNAFQPNQGPLTLMLGDARRVYDFKAWTVRNEKN